MLNADGIDPDQLSVAVKFFDQFRLCNLGILAREHHFRSNVVNVAAQQIFMLGCSPARDTEASYVAYGHSILADPWGRVLGELGEKEGLLSAKVDLGLVDAVRQQIPLRTR